MLQTDPHPLAVRYAVTLPRIKGVGQSGLGATVDLDYDLTQSSQPLPKDLAEISSESRKQPLTLAVRIGLSAHPKRTGYRYMPFELRFVDREHPRPLHLDAERPALSDHPSARHRLGCWRIGDAAGRGLTVVRVTA